MSSLKPLHFAVAGLVAVVILITAVVLVAGKSSSDEPDSLPAPDAALIARNHTPRNTTVSLLAGGGDLKKIDERVFDLIVAGVSWDDLKAAVFPGSEVELVLIYPDTESRSVGLETNREAQARVDALWQEIQPDRERSLYIGPVGDLANVEVERWLREKLTALGFRLSNDIKSRERLLYTVTR